MFDRDEPTREKEVYLTVRATDNGKPHLDDVCTIKVTIQDENDNSPVFDKVVSPIFKILSPVHQNRRIFSLLKKRILSRKVALYFSNRHNCGYMEVIYLVQFVKPVCLYDIICLLGNP